MLRLSATAATAVPRHGAGRSIGNGNRSAAAAASPALAARGRARSASLRAVACGSTPSKSSPPGPPRTPSSSSGQQQQQQQQQAAGADAARAAKGPAADVPPPSSSSLPSSSCNFNASFSFTARGDDGAAALSASVKADPDLVMAFSRMLPALLAAQQQEADGGAGATVDAHMSGAAAAAALAAAAAPLQAAAAKGAAGADAKRGAASPEAEADSKRDAADAEPRRAAAVAAYAPPSTVPPPGSTHVLYQGGIFPLLRGDGGGTVIYCPMMTDLRALRPGVGLRFLSLPACEKTAERVKQLQDLGAVAFEPRQVDSSNYDTEKVWSDAGARKHIVLNGELWPVFPADAALKVDRQNVSVPPSRIFKEIGQTDGLGAGEAVRMTLYDIYYKQIPNPEYFMVYLF